jgi:hypothetical protein
MMRAVLGVTLALGLVGTGAVGAVAGSLADEIKVESIHSGVIRLGRVNLPLPDGEWVVTAVDEYKNKQNSLLAQVEMASFVNGKTLSGYIVVNVNEDISGSGWDVHKFCSRTDVYYLMRGPDVPNDQTCWGVNHYVFEKTSTYKPAQGSNIQAYVARRGQVMPGTLINTLFRFANRNNFLTYQLYANPTLAGFTDESGKWADSSWHKDLVAADPKKVEFLERVKAQSAQLFDVMKDGGVYKERPGAAPPTTAPATVVETPPDAPSIEQRLVRLKDLFDRNLITAPEYEAKRKQILGEL